MAGWDDDEDEDDEQADDFALEPPDGWPDFELPDSWEAWWEFDWDSYDGEYEEFAVSADYEG